MDRCYYAKKNGLFHTLALSHPRDVAQFHPGWHYGKQPRLFLAIRKVRVCVVCVLCVCVCVCMSVCVCEIHQTLTFLSGQHPPL